MSAYDGAKKHLHQLGPHQRGRETARHLELCLMEIEQLKAKLTEAERLNKVALEALKKVKSHLPIGGYSHKAAADAIKEIEKELL